MSHASPNSSHKPLLFGDSSFLATALNAGPEPTSQIAAEAPKRRLPITFRGIAQAAICLDVALIGVAAIASQIIAQIIRPIAGSDPFRDIAAAIFVAVLFVTAQKINDLYSPMELLNWRLQLRSVLGAWIGAFMVLASGLFTWRLGDTVSRIDLVMFGAVGGALLLAHRLAWLVVLPGAIRTGGLRRRPSALLACEEVDRDYVARALHAFGNTVSFSAPLHRQAGDDGFVSEIDALIASVRGQDVEEIFVAADIADVPRLKEITTRLRVLPQPVTLLPIGALRDLVRMHRVDLGAMVALELLRAPLSNIELAAKRVVDVVVSLVGLILLSPILLAASIAIALDSPGPILFRQTRHGFNGRAFQIYKFRSMRVLENGAVIRQATQNDPRVTSVGKFLRRYSIDELPQLLNVLAGDMSIVGPRPHAAAHDQHFYSVLKEYAFRQHVKGGLTGWAQVKGARGETDTLEKMQRRVELDIWYISNWSLWLDFYIMLKTVLIVFKAENAH